MNNTIPLPRLVESLAAMTGSSESLCDSFVRELFTLISDALTDGNSVKIKYIGSFTPTGDGKVEYIPDKDIEAALNRPFEFFEPVELSDDVTEDMLEVTGYVESDHESTPEDDSAYPSMPEVEAVTMTTQPQEAAEESPAEESPVEAGTSPDTDIDTDNNTDTDADANADAETTPETDRIITSLIYPEQPERHSHSHHGRKRFIAGLVTGVLTGLIIGSAATYLLLNNRQKNAVIIERITHTGNATTDSTTMQEAVAAVRPDSAETDRKVAPAAKTTPADTERLDTISHNKFLTTMARKYYGEMIFWVYIYEENKDRLSHPDRISPGTVVRIPDAAKYGIDRDNPQSTADARAKAVEIYGRFK